MMLHRHTTQDSGPGYYPGAGWLDSGSTLQHPDLRQNEQAFIDPNLGNSLSGESNDRGERARDMNRGRMRIGIWGSMALAAIALSVWLAYAMALRAGLEQLRVAGQHRLDVVAARLDGELSRFDYLPSLLESTTDVFELLARPDDASLKQHVSGYLHGITATAGADNLYVTQRSGMTLAAADWNQPGTPVGADLSFRPYMRDALEHGYGRFYGVGFTSGRPGYYLAFALRQDGVQRGVATVKVNLDAVERNWVQIPGKVLVVDARDVVILASLPQWRLRPLAPLTAAMLAEAARARTYGKSDLMPLDWQVRSRLDQHTTRVRLDSVEYLASERTVNHGLWRIVLLDDELPARTLARNAAIGALLAGMVLFLLILVVAQRRRAAQQQMAAQRALREAHDSLEGKVLERTAELRALQNDLVHAGKLAALGQMSAGIVHELNQPLAAMRTLSDNAAVLLEHGRFGDAAGNLRRIANLIGRVARLTQQLKAFAHKTQAPLRPVAMHQVIQDALFVVTARLRELDVNVDVAATNDDFCVLADEPRLEQVLVNLLGNAADALSGATVRKLEIGMAQCEGQCVLTIRDSGPGIHPDVLPRLFEPFVTTKPAGKGLGLGLMISAHIVREFGGRMYAQNLPPGGAELVVELPLAPPTQGEHQ
ncbi:ATP-binding protein [Cupriavidus oxalaticus]|uniref:C4-dicarboxylate transport sensor protein DctB n=1 Tax=Cupriavidus oxalaticus TaxID=96344 RepID=A0A4P7LHD8_9BURK|nr:ATP-binding protein [Cupriavidus oxalaticus]QBY55644.1 sensor histidine kinase [Cupriavidus oxalaticus]